MAVTATAADFAGLMKATLEQVSGTWAGAVAYVTRYAPGAPEAVANEAAVRFASHLYQTRTLQPFEVSLRDLTVTPPASTAAAFRASGAAALLSPWRVRRAGRVEASS